MEEVARSFPKSSGVLQLCIHPRREEQVKATARQLALGKSLESQDQKSQCGAREHGSTRTVVILWQSCRGEGTWEGDKSLRQTARSVQLVVIARVLVLNCSCQHRLSSGSLSEYISASALQMSHPKMDSVQVDQVPYSQDTS